MAILVLLFFALAAALLFLDSSGGSRQPALPPEVQQAQSAAAATETAETTAQPEENIILTAVCTQDKADAWVEAGASVSSPGQIISLTCTVTGSDGDVLYLDTVTADYGKWEIVGQTGDCVVRVSAMTASGRTESWEQNVSFTAPEFIWPVEPQYQVLLHDRFQVSSGSKTVGGYSHNNGRQREKHYVFGNRRNHYGFDITAPEGSEVRAAAAGTVLGLYTDTDSTGSTGYGRYIIIRHEAKHNGMTVYTLYAHLSKVLVKSGDKVAQGQTVALSGNTGGSRIPHLHLEFRLDGNNHSCAVDPLELLPGRDFSRRSASLAGEPGFKASSIALYADMLDGGWEYAIPARLRSATTLGGTEYPAGTSVEIIYRSEDTVSFVCGGAAYNGSTSILEYTFD